jgi:UDP-N-acetylglucosamine 2-epimerase (non-hydrolysing)
MKVVTVVGARPQFIKCAPVSRELRKVVTEVIIHTGQHYDGCMNDVFFHDLEIPTPEWNLGVGSGPHGAQTAEMLKRIEEVLLIEWPDYVMTYGDTNSTLAGALAAAKLHIPVAHIEAGLRSFNRRMPEEINRVMTDHLSTTLFCPTETALQNLAREGVVNGIHLVGDVMYDAALQFAAVARRRSTILADLGLKPKEYLLATVHRPSNTDSEVTLGAIMSSLREISEPIVFPVHPRTRQRLRQCGWDNSGSSDRRMLLLEPVGYLDMLMLEENARIILTDSGGLQKEAYFFRVPCVTLRLETEWVETVSTGWNVIVGTDRTQILNAVNGRRWPQGTPPQLFGDGHAAHCIVDRLVAGQSAFLSHEGSCD